MPLFVRRVVLPLVVSATLTIEAEGQDTLRIRQVLPAGELRPASVVTMTFNRPLAGTIERLRDPATVVRVEPAIPVRFEWRDPATLRAIPLQPLRPGTSFTLRIDTLSAPDGSRLAVPFTRTFQVRPPALLGSDPMLQPGARPSLTPSGLVRLRISGEVDPADFGRVARYVVAPGATCAARLPDAEVRARVVVRVPVPTDPWTLQGAGRDSVEARFDRIVEMEPAQSLPEDCIVDLVIPLDDGVRGAAEVRYPVRSASPFRATLQCRNVGDCTSGRGVLVSFTAPVAHDAFVRHVRVTPARGLVMPDSGPPSAWWMVQVALAPDDTVRVTLDAGLRDVHGRSLASTGPLSVVVGDRIPRWSTTQGLVTIARSTATPALRVRHVNLDEVRVTLFRNPNALAIAATNPLARGASGASMVPDSVQYTLSLDTPINTERTTALPLRLPDPAWRDHVVGVRLEVTRRTRRPGGAPLRIDAGIAAQPFPDLELGVQFSDLMAHTRAGAGGGAVLVTDVRTGRPTAGVTARAYNDEMHVAASASTNGSGLASWAVDPRRVRGEGRGRGRGEVMYDDPSWPLRAVTGVEVSRGRERAWTPVGNAMSPFARGRFVGGWHSSPAWRRAAVFTDRDIYRPGERVYFSAIVRDGFLGAFSAPAGERVRWILRPAMANREGRQEVLFERRGTLSAFGTAADSLRVAEAWPIGLHYLSLERRQGGQWVVSSQVPINVEEYRAPEFTVSGAVREGTLVRGDTARATFNARLLLDAPLAEAPVQWVAQFRALQPWEITVPGLGTEWQLGRAPNWWEEREAQFHAGRSGTAQTGNDGRLAIPVPTDPIPEGRDARLQLDATVTDVNGQTVSASASAIVASASFHLAMKSSGNRWWWAVGEPVAVQVGAITGAGAWVDGVRLDVTVLRRRWIWRDAFGQPAMRVVVDTIRRDSVVTRDSSATVTVLPSSDGAWEVEVRGRDAMGRRTEASISRWAVGGERGWWWPTNEGLQVAVSRDSLRSGDSLTVSFASPYDAAHAWVTVTREQVLLQRLVRVGRGVATLTLPVSEAWIPNATVGVVLVRDGDLTATDSLPERFVEGEREVRIDPSPRRLQVTLRPRAPEYRPGAAAEVDVEVRDARGRPVRGDVVVWATDEGVLSLTGFRTPEPASQLLAPIGKTMGFGTTLSSLLQDLRLADDDPGAAPRGLMADYRMRGVSTVQLSQTVTTSTALSSEGVNIPRSNFRSTAFYRAAVRTGVEGRGTVTIRLPDNVTTFRLMALAVDAAQAFGGGEGKLLVTKPLVARAAMPRFVRPQDRFSAGAAINVRGRDSVTTVRAHASVSGAMEISGAAQKEVRVGPAGAMARFDWIATGREGDARVTLGARGLGDADAVATTIPLRPDQVPRARTLVALVRDSTTLRFTLPRTVDASRSRLVMRVGATPLPMIRAWVAELQAYPYYCTEQLASAARGMIALLQLHAAGATRLEDAARLRRQLTTVVGELAKRQRGDGSFGYWSATSWTNAWLDAFVGEVLLDAQGLGIAVPSAMVERLGVALTTWLGNSSAVPDTSYGTASERRRTITTYLSHRVAAVDVVSRIGSELDYLPQLERQVGHMTFEDQARFAAVLARRMRGQALARRILTGLWELAPVVGNRVDLDPVALEGTGFPSRIRPAARLLKATQAIDPDHPGIGPLVQRIIQRDQAAAGWWWNTQDYAFAAQGMADFMKTVSSPAARFEVRGGGKVLLAGAGAVSERTVALTSLAEAAGDSVVVPLTVRVAGAPVYVSMTVQSLESTPPVAPDPFGLVVERWYERFDTGATVTEVQAGDLVRVRVRVTARGDREFVAVEDPLPAGLEVVDTRWRTQSLGAYLTPEALAVDRAMTAVAGGDDVAGWWRWNPWEHVETRDDRVVFHARLLGAGTHVYSYVARATTAGRFVRPQAHAVEMYNPGLGGRSDGGWFVVQPGSR